MTSTRRTPRLAAAAVVAALALAGCSATASGDGGDPTAPSADSRYPMTLSSPFGETELTDVPERVAVVSAVDLDVALALDVVPVIAPRYGDSDLEPWTQAALDAQGAELDSYDSSDGTDYAAIAAAEPDVILATSGWTLDEDYEQLAKIAPVVSFQGEDGLSSMTWAERTAEAAAALGLEQEGEQVVEDVAQAFADARAAHPELEGRTFTYAVIHPAQITYESYAGGDVSFFEALGLTQPSTAEQFSAEDSAVAKENVDLLDADLLLVGYPFGDEGLLSRDALESDPLFTQVPAVAAGRYAVVGDEIASPLAYPTPLSQPWVLEQFVPVLAQAAAKA